MGTETTAISDGMYTLIGLPSNVTVIVSALELSLVERWLPRAEDMLVENSTAAGVCAVDCETSWVGKNGSVDEMV